VPTTILQLEASDLPRTLEIPARYDNACVLVRWRGHPVAQMMLPVRDGLVDGDRLRDAVVEHASQGIGERRLHEFLGRDEGQPATPLPSATIAVCTRDRPDDLERCLRALDELLDDGQETVVVDSCSTRDDTRQVAARFPHVRYVREERPGLDIARNRALAEARHEVVAFTDDDAAPDPGWLRALMRGFADPRTLCVTGLTLPLELETEAQEWFERTNAFGRGFRRRTFDGVSMDAFNAAHAGAGVNMALRRSVLELVGPFDEALDAGTPTRSGGDHDMFTRILLAGYCITYEPTALNWHRHRREWSELRDTVRGYGMGVYAYLTGHLMRREVRAPMIALGWLRWQLAGIVRSRKQPTGHITRDLAFAELGGCAAGPRAYFVSRRLARRKQVPSPTPLDSSPEATA
jgi:glycosyltransferase involved in cell wall biosynthesis